ncbi:MAG: NHL domain-containing protein [Bacteroidia bacterium]
MKKIITLLTLTLGISAHAQIITPFAGDTTIGNSGDGGPALTARFDTPVHASMDAAGNIYVADQNNRNVRKIDTAGIITTIAGTGVYGYAGDGGPATAALLGGPTNVVPDGKGNLYIMDYNNYVVRKIDTAGIITTVVGTGVAGYTGDGGPATAATLQGAAALAFDSKGNLYIADNQNFVIRMVDTAGIITTVAGNGTGGYSGDGGPALSAQLTYPLGVMIDAVGNLYIGDTYNNCIRKVDTAGIITTIAGVGGPTGAFGGDGGLAINAQFNAPVGMSLDAAGNLYIADAGNHVIRKIDTMGIITSVAGNTIMGFAGNGGPATRAELNDPNNIIVTPSNLMYIVDDANHCIREVCLNTDSVFGYIKTPSNTAVTAGKVYAFKRQQTHNGLNDTLGFVNIQPNGFYSFPNTFGNNFLIKAIADTISYPNAVPTYYGTRNNLYQWDSSSVVLFDPCNSSTLLGDSITIQMITPAVGSGSISGQITQSIGYGTRQANGGNYPVLGAPLKGVDIKLGKNPGGTCAARTTTDNTGSYIFTNLSPGDYSIYVDVPNFPMDSVLSITIAGSTQSVDNNYYIDSAYVRVDSTAHTTAIKNTVGNLSEIKIYPNPSRSFIYVDGISDIHTTCTLFDVNGKLVKQVVFNNNATIALNVADVNEGVYNLNIITNGNTVNKRVVIIK